MRVIGNLEITGGQLDTSIKVNTDGNINWNNSNIQSLTLTQNETLSFSNPTVGGMYQLILKQDGTGSRTVTWPTIKWEGGIAPTLTATAGKVDVIHLLYDGTDYYGWYKLNF